MDSRVLAAATNKVLEAFILLIELRFRLEIEYIGDADVFRGIMSLERAVLLFIYLSQARFMAFS